MPDDADLSLPALATMIAEFLTELNLRHVTLVCNDWGGRATRHQPRRRRSCRQRGPSLLRGHRKRATTPLDRRPHPEVYRRLNQRSE